MATSTLGSNANNSLPVAMAFSPTNPVADFATIEQAILDDTNRLQVWRGAWSKNGVLYVPNRGFLTVRPGDWVAVDNRGWPILLSADTIASGAWTHNP